MFYYTKVKCSEMSDDEIKECSQLFSEHYGVWSSQCPNIEKRGKPVKLSSAKIREMFVNKDDRYVAFVRLKSTRELVGHAFYLRRALSHPRNLKGKYVTWVLQLVVKREFRGNRLGSILLHSIWGRSDDFAWGLYTSNPMTIRALEEATFRRVSVKKIQQHQNKLASIASDIFNDVERLRPNNFSIVNTDFFVDHSNQEERIERAYGDIKRKFPFTHLNEGEEWFAFTFRSQQQQLMTSEALEKMSVLSQESLMAAYSYMDMEAHSWAKHTKHEIDYLFQNKYIDLSSRVLDLGCGYGRHVIELGERGNVVHGVDFCESRIAKLSSEYENVKNITFECTDVRNYSAEEKFDVILCLYDVLGSSTREDDNKQIVATINRNLTDGGVAVVSVMNLHLTEKICSKRVFDFSKNRKKILNLLPSKVMQKSGNCFDGKYLLMEETSKIIYKRELFELKGQLPVEFIVPDKRYYKDELVDLFSKDFTLESIKFVHSGNWVDSQEPTSVRAKEILAIFRKKKHGILSSLLRSH